MHHCLRVDEILRHFASELVASKGKASAVTLACCCKSFEDPVLDVLWETQEWLAPLFKTFPKYVWYDEERAVGTPTILILCLLERLFPVFRKVPDGAGMSSIPRICPKDAKARRRLAFVPTIANFHGIAVSYLRRTFVPKFEISYVGECHQESRSPHLSIPFPRSHLHRSYV